MSLFQLEESMKPLRPYERRDTLKQFLDHDHKVLRFYCYWDDSDDFGDPRKLILHYFLADDTIDIWEVIPPNSGRHAGTKFLHRGKLPKVKSTKRASALHRGLDNYQTANEKLAR